MPDHWDISPREGWREELPKGISREDGGAQLESDTLFLAEVGNPFGFHWVYGRDLPFFHCSGH